MHLQDQPAGDMGLRQGGVDANQRHLEDVGGKALDARVHRLTLACLANPEVGVGQLRDRTAAAEQRLGVATHACLDHRAVHICLHVGESDEVCIEDHSRIGRWDPQSLTEPVGLHAVRQPVADHLGLRPHLDRDVVRLDTEHSGRGGVVDVDTAAERLDQPGVGSEVSDAAQLDLVVVGDQQRVAGRRHEGLAELAALVAANRDVVEIRLIAAETPGAGDGLVESRVDPAVGSNLGHQAGSVGAAELLHLPVPHQRIDELRPLVAQPQQRRCVGRVPGLGLLLRCQLLLGVQQFAQLNRRVEVERPTDDALELGRESFALQCEVLVESLQLGHVDGDADVFHLGEHTDQGVLDRGIQLGHALLVECGLQCRRQVCDRQRATAGDAPVVVALLAEIELSGRRRIVRRQLVRGVALQQVGERVSNVGGVDQVRGDRHVELQPGDRHTVSERPAHEGLGVVPTQPRVRSESRKHRWFGDDRGRDPCHFACVTIGDEGKADEVAAARLTDPRADEIERRQRRDRTDDGSSIAEIGDLRFQHLCLGRGLWQSRCSQGLEQPVGQGAELEEVEQLPCRFHVGLDRQRVEVDVDRSVATKDHQFGIAADALFVFGQRGPQLRRLRVDVGEDPVEAAVGVDQLRSSLLTDAGDTVEVVARIAT